MKRLLVVLAFLAASCLNVAGQDQLVKQPSSVYICTFKVYKLGAVAPKYLAIDDEGEDDEESAAWGMPQRTKDLARVLAVGKFVQKLERLLGRPVLPKRPGHPRKQREK